MTVSRLAFAIVAGLAFAAPASAREGVSHGFTGFTATADAASLARIRDAKPIGTRAEASERERTEQRSDKVLEALKPIFGKKK